MDITDISHCSEKIAGSGTIFFISVDRSHQRCLLDWGSELTWNLAYNNLQSLDPDPGGKLNVDPKHLLFEVSYGFTADTKIECYSILHPSNIFFEKIF